MREIQRSGARRQLLQKTAEGGRRRLNKFSWLIARRIGKANGWRARSRMLDTAYCKRRPTRSNALGNEKATEIGTPIAQRAREKDATPQQAAQGSARARFAGMAGRTESKAAQSGQGATQITEKTQWRAERMRQTEEGNCKNLPEKEDVVSYARGTQSEIEVAL